MSTEGTAFADAAQRVRRGTADAVAEARSGRTGAGVGLAYGGVVEE